jgi:hypothetical protein
MNNDMDKRLLGVGDVTYAESVDSDEETHSLSTELLSSSLCSSLPESQQEQ